MDANELNELRELVEFLKANEIAEFDMERSDLKVRIKFTGGAPAPAAGGLDLAQLKQLLGNQGGQVPAVSASAAAPAASAPPPVAAAPPAADPDAGLHIVRSPIVGTFYDAPSPGSEPFEKLGDQVEVGTVLCIIEAMKLMNEIESDAVGEIAKIFVANGQPVEYGQPLYGIRVR
jgi:acetyl-CoA carboxylase biotin carboxyl carrier protein